MVPIVDTFSAPKVYVRRRWHHAWRLEADLDALAAARTVGPQLGSAQLRWQYGRRTFRDDPTFQTVRPFGYSGWFVQIRATIATVVTELFTGLFIDDDLEAFGAIDLGGGDWASSGDQIYQAVDLSYLLDRRQLRSAKVSQTVTNSDGKPVKKVVEIDHVPTLNRSGPGGAIFGNRSKFSVDKVFHFSSEGFTWSHHDFIEMVLAELPFRQMIFSLGGQSHLLKELRSVLAVELLTVKGLLDKLVDRRRGLGWTIGNVGFGLNPEVPIEIFTIFDEPITVGDVEISPNRNSVSLNLNGGPELQQVSLRLTESARFDSIRVRGERLISCFTLTKDQFEKNWTAEEELAYLDGVKEIGGYDLMDASTQKQLNDKYRASDRFRRVFRQFHAREGWDWKIPRKAPLPDLPVTPSFDNEGQILGFSGPSYDGDRRFLRRLPLMQGVDYGETPTVNRNPSGSVPEFLPPFVLIQELSVAGAESGTPTWHQLDRLGETMTNASGIPVGSIGLRLSDSEAAFELLCRPNHLAGKNHFTLTATDPELPELPDPTAAESSATSPLFDWKTMTVTLAIATDQRLSVVVKANRFSVQDEPRELVIDVPGAQAWHVVEGTVVGLDADGEPITFGGDLRNDADILQAVAAAALSWYGRRRQVLEVTVASLIVPVLPGDLVVSVLNGDDYDEVNTPVTLLSWNFLDGTTYIATQFAQLDLAGTATPTANRVSTTSPGPSGQSDLLGGSEAVRESSATSGGASSLVVAKTQEDGITTDGVISVKRIDAEGTDIDTEPFDVWLSLNKSTSLDMGNYWPRISNAQIVLIEKINTEWFLLFPQITNVGKWL